MNDDVVQGKFFLDTNILVYSFDSTNSHKQSIARGLISTALSSAQGAISSQVVQEFLNVSQRKFAVPLSLAESRQYLNTVLLPLCQHYPSIGFYERALLLREETGYSFYDSLIVSAAIETECKVLVTEDMQHGRIVQGVTILNPFPR